MKHGERCEHIDAILAAVAESPVELDVELRWADSMTSSWPALWCRTCKVKWVRPDE